MGVTIDRKLVLPVASVVGASLFAVVLGQLPGDSVTRSITIHHSAGLPSRLSFIEHGVADG